MHIIRYLFILKLIRILIEIHLRTTRIVTLYMVTRMRINCSIKFQRHPFEHIQQHSFTPHNYSRVRKSLHT